MFQLRYDYRHTFFISGSILLFIFGFYPFYTIPNILEVPLKTIFFHIPLICLAVWLMLKGIDIWKEADKDKKDITEFRKEEMKRNNDTKRIQCQAAKLRIKKEELLFKRMRLEEDITNKEKENAQLKEEHKKKTQEIEKLEKDIINKEQALIDKENKIYSERMKSIQKLPDSYFSTGSGIGLISYSSSSSPPSVYERSESNFKVCSKCGMPYETGLYSLDEGVCSKCKGHRISWANP